MRRSGRQRERQAPRVEIRPIAAGEVVHADGRSSLMEKVRRNFSDAGAVDMESLGLYEAAHRDDLPALAVRGISDCVGDKQPDADREWQPRAARPRGRVRVRAAAPGRAGRLPEPAPGRCRRAGRARSPTPSPVQQMLRCRRPSALAYEWALPLAGARASAVLGELAELGGQPATWLSRFRHRPPPMFRGEDSAALWVLVAEFADSHEHPGAPWFIRAGGGQRWHGDVLSRIPVLQGGGRRRPRCGPGESGRAAQPAPRPPRPAAGACGSSSAPPSAPTSRPRLRRSSAVAGALELRVPEAGSAGARRGRTATAAAG